MEKDCWHNWVIHNVLNISKSEVIVKTYKCKKCNKVKTVSTDKETKERVN